MGKRLKFRWKLHQRKPVMEVLVDQLPGFFLQLTVEDKETVI